MTQVEASGTAETWRLDNSAKGGSPEDVLTASRLNASEVEPAINDNEACSQPVKPWLATWITLVVSVVPPVKDWLPAPL